MALTKITGEGVGTLSSSGATTATFNRTTSDGTIIDVQKSGSTVGSIGYESSGFHINGEANHSGLSFQAPNVTPRYNGSLTDDFVHLGSTSNRFKNLYLSGGVYLGGTGSANYLDDVETGTFTPAINSGATGGSYSGTGGNYTKIGNFVTFTIRFQPVGWTANGDGFNLSGLPFTSATGVQQGGAFFNYIGNFETPTPTMHISAGSNLIVFFNTNGAGLVGNTIDNLNVTIHIQGFYYAA